MKTVFLLALAIVTAGATPLWSQSGTPSEANSASVGQSLQVELTRGIDARKARVGDPVLARCMEDFLHRGEVLIPKNAKLLGHLTQVKRRDQGDSLLGILFDRAQMRDGRSVPLDATIVAMAPPLLDDSTDEAVPDTSSGPQQSPVIRNLNSTATAQLQAKAHTATGLPGELPATQHPNSTALTLNDESHGVIGMKGLELDAPSATSDKASVIRSSSQNVRLESGTRILLRVGLQ